MFRSIMPLPMVLATAVPRRNAARKLKDAAQATASRGESTRVETTVAMLLAASWKPFRKSKTNAVRTVNQSRIIPAFTSAHPELDLAGYARCRASSVLQNYGLKYVGDVFRFIRRGFENLK